METLERVMELLPLLIPVLIIDLGFKIYALIDILKEDRIVRGNKVVWIIVSIVVNFGWIFYFLFGRDE